MFVRFHDCNCEHLRGLKGDLLLFPTSMLHGCEVHPDAPYNPAPKDIRRINISLYSNKKHEVAFQTTQQSECGSEKRCGNLSEVLSSLICMGGEDLRKEVDKLRDEATVQAAKALAQRTTAHDAELQTRSTRRHEGIGL